MQIDVLGIDLAKRVFQLHGVTSSGMAVHRSKVSRPSLLQAIERLCPRMVVMEACASAHHWARLLLAKGIVVKLVSPQFVAPFVKTNKNDRNDAEGIVEAASRPAMRFVAIKSIEQQDIQALHRLRELYVHQRTAVINHVRAALAERGVIIGKSPAAFHRAMPAVLAPQDGEITADCQVPAVLEGPGIANGGNDGRGGERADSFDLPHPWHGWLCFISCLTRASASSMRCPNS